MDIEKQDCTTDQLLRENEYRVPVGSYGMPHDNETLERNFSLCGVSFMFKGHRSWRQHRSYVKIDETPGERIMLVKHFNRETESEANVVEMDKLGYRPANHVEAYVFAQSHPDLQRRFSIVALGSSTMFGCRQYVAVLKTNIFDDRVFTVDCFESMWKANDRFLFVRK